MNKEGPQGTPISIYLPTLMFQLGLAMTVPFIPLFAKGLGASIALIGAISAARSIGSMLFNIPGTFIVTRFRLRSLMIISLSACGIAAGSRGLSTSPLMLLVSSFILGMSSSLWQLARLTYTRERMPKGLRNQTLANIGGIMRIARIVSPVIGGTLVAVSGYRVIFFIQGLLMIPACLAVFFMIPREGRLVREPHRETLRSLRSHLGRHRRTIAAGMIGMIGLTIVRSSHGLLIPLWADHLGLTANIIGIITSTAALVELLLVIPGGKLSNLRGPQFVAATTIFSLSLSLCLIPFTGSFSSLLFVAIAAALGNGLGSGINMIIGVSLAPDRHAGQFLSMWRFITDAGLSLGPFLVGLVAAAFSLSLAPYVIACIGITAGSQFRHVSTDQMTPEVLPSTPP